MPDYNNIFHTLCSNVGNKYFEQHLFLKHQSGLHRYIKTDMDFIDIPLGVIYLYFFKLEQKLKQRNNKEFGFANPLQ